MIFAPEAIEKIRAREKTQTRRAIKLATVKGSRHRPVTVSQLPGYAPLKPVRKPAPCRYREGRVYSCQPGYAQKSVLQITVTEVRVERLGAITPQDVKREGYKFPTEFQARWVELHGAWTPDKDVWVITFVVGDARGVWDQPRLLNARPGHLEYETLPPEPGKKAGRVRVAPVSMNEHQDYTTDLARGLIDEPEPLTPAALDGLAWPDPDRRAKSLAARLKLAQRRGDANEMRLISEELQKFADDIETAA